MKPGQLAMKIWRARQVSHSVSIYCMCSEDVGNREVRENEELATLHLYAIRFLLAGGVSNDWVAVFLQVSGKTVSARNSNTERDVLRKG